MAGHPTLARVAGHPRVGGKPGPKRRLPERLQGDRANDSELLRILLRWLGITPVLAARNTEHGSGLGVYRWFVERTISWLHSFGRLRRRLDRLGTAGHAESQDGEPGLRRARGRTADRENAASRRQFPPRFTRHEPPEGPAGSDSGEFL